MGNHNSASVDRFAAASPAEGPTDPELERLRARQANVWYLLALIAILELLVGGWLISTLARSGN